MVEGSLAAAPAAALAGQAAAVPSRGPQLSPQLPAAPPAPAAGAPAAEHAQQEETTAEPPALLSSLSPAAAGGAGFAGRSGDLANLRYRVDQAVRISEWDDDPAPPMGADTKALARGVAGALRDAGLLETCESNLLRGQNASLPQGPALTELRGAAPAVGDYQASIEGLGRAALSDCRR